MTDSPPPTSTTCPSVMNDRDLLRRFVQDADQRAFADIVRRHQGLVIGVCRRVLGNSPDVDDAFQATFLTLARRPRQVRNAASISSWLYTVAWRTSWRLIRQRRKHPVEPLTDQPEPSGPGPLDRIASAQDGVVLDEELNALPKKYREVLVMTYFAGQGSQQIADELSVSKGTVDGRIRQARNMLRVRLARRGVAIGALAAAAGLSTGATAAASPALLQTTLQVGAQTLSGSVPGTTDLSHLEPFIRAETTMITSKLLLSAAVCVTAMAGLAGMNGFRPGDETGGGDVGVPQVQAEITVEANSEVPPAVAVDVSAPTDSADVPASDDPFGIPGVSGGSGLGGMGMGMEGPGMGMSAQADGRGERRFEYYPADARPVERWMYDMLETPIPTLDFPGETPLREILDTIRDYYSNTHGDTDAGKFDLTIYPDYKEFDLEGVTGIEDVLVKDVSFGNGMELRNALDLIFEQISEPVELAYEIRNEVLFITTESRATSEDFLVTRIYHVDELLDLDFGDDVVYPVGGGGMGGGMGGGGGGGGGFMSVPQGKGKKKAQAQSDTIEETSVTVLKRNLADVVMEMTSPPCQWLDIDGQGGAIRIVGRSLVVRQTPTGHREIVRLLNLLSESAVKAK